MKYGQPDYKNMISKQLILTMPNTFNENPFTTPQKVIKETIELINQTY